VCSSIYLFVCIYIFIYLYNVIIRLTSQSTRKNLFRSACAPPFLYIYIYIYRDSSMNNIINRLHSQSTRESNSASVCSSILFICMYVVRQVGVFPLGHHQRWWWPSGECALLGYHKNRSPHRKRLLGAITKTARRERLAPGLRPPWDSNHSFVVSQVGVFPYIYIKL